MGTQNSHTSTLFSIFISIPELSYLISLNSMAVMVANICISSSGLSPEPPMLLALLPCLVHPAAYLTFSLEHPLFLMGQVLLHIHCFVFILLILAPFYRWGHCCLENLNTHNLCMLGLGVWMQLCLTLRFMVQKCHCHLICTQIFLYVLSVWGFSVVLHWPVFLLLHKNQTIFNYSFNIEF